MKFPLSCVIDFCGLRVVATSLLPMKCSATNLVFGVDTTNGNFKEENRNIKQIMEKLGAEIGLCNYTTNSMKKPVFFSDIFLDGTRIFPSETKVFKKDVSTTKKKMFYFFQDDTFYLINTADIFPPLPFKLGESTVIQFFRLEFLKFFPSLPPYVYDGSLSDIIGHQNKLKQVSKNFGRFFLTNFRRRIFSWKFISQILLRNLTPNLVRL